MNTNSPLRLVAILASTIFVEELSVAFWLSDVEWLSRFQGALLDSVLLLILTAPSLYWFLVRPMRRQIEARDTAAKALEQAKAALEERVSERTAELAEASRNLETSLQTLADTHQETLLLGELIDLLQACRTEEESEEMLRRFGRTLFPSETGAVYIYRSSRNLLELAASWGEEQAMASTFSSEDCWALRRGRQHVTEHGDRTPCCPHLQAQAPGKAVCIPMMAQGEATGVLVLVAEQSQRLPEVTQKLAAGAAEQIALALANLQLREKLRDQAIRDPLTGIFNRRYFEETVVRELHRADRQGTCASMIMLDVDHFKRFNDTYGHDAGDAVLKKIGVVLQNKIRVEDIPCRYGGEEFAVLFPDMGLEEVIKCAEQLRTVVRDLNIHHRGQTLSTVTISCGVAVHPDHGQTFRELMEAADRALYRAKDEGRDRVIVAGDKAADMVAAAGRDR